MYSSRFQSSFLILFCRANASSMYVALSSIPSVPFTDSDKELYLNQRHVTPRPRGMKKSLLRFYRDLSAFAECNIVIASQKDTCLSLSPTHTSLLQDLFNSAARRTYLQGSRIGLHVSISFLICASTIIENICKSGNSRSIFPE